MNVKMIEITDVEVAKHIPKWFPMNERALQSYLIRNSSVIAEDAEFLGCEVFYIDLLFQNATKYFIVETKCSKNLNVDYALQQLSRYTDIIGFGNPNKELEPILAVLKNSLELQREELYPKYRSVNMERIGLLNSIRIAKKNIGDLNQRMSTLLRKVNRLRIEREKLLRQKRSLKSTVSDSQWDNHLKKRLEEHILLFSARRSD